MPADTQDSLTLLWLFKSGGGSLGAVLYQHSKLTIQLLIAAALGIGKTLTVGSAAALAQTAAVLGLQLGFSTWVLCKRPGSDRIDNTQTGVQFLAEGLSTLLLLLKAAVPSLRSEQDSIPLIAFGLAIVSVALPIMRTLYDAIIMPACKVGLTPSAARRRASPIARPRARPRARARSPPPPVLSLQLYMGGSINIWFSLTKLYTLALALPRMLGGLVEMGSALDGVQGGAATGVVQGVAVENEVEGDGGLRVEDISGTDARADGASGAAAQAADQSNMAEMVGEAIFEEAGVGATATAAKACDQHATATGMGVTNFRATNAAGGGGSGWDVLRGTVGGGVGMGGPGVGMGQDGQLASELVLAGRLGDERGVCGGRGGRGGRRERRGNRFFNVARRVWPMPPMLEPEREDSEDEPLSPATATLTAAVASAEEGRADAEARAMLDAMVGASTRNLSVFHSRDGASGGGAGA